MKALLQTAGVALLLIAAYALALALLPQPATRRYASQWDENRAKAQNYGRGREGAHVIAGSSLARLLPRNALGNCFVNLAFAGESANTGLALVLAGEVAPALVLVEANVLERQVNRELADAGTALSARVPVLRVDARPLNYLFSQLYSLGYDPAAEHRRRMAAAASEATREQALRWHLQNRHPLDAADFAQRIDELDRQLTALEKRGASIVLLELPVDARLRNDEPAAQARAVVTARFGQRYRMIDTATLREHWETTDGLHLDYPGASFLAEWISRTFPCTDDRPGPANGPRLPPP